MYYRWVWDGFGMGRFYYCDEESQTPPMASPDSRPSRRPATN